MAFAKMVVMGTGGTIAGRSSVAGDNVGYRAGEVSVADLLSGLPQLVPGLAGCQVEALQVAQVDSKDMGPAVWMPLLSALRVCVADPAVKAIVVTHGTDTLEETAYLLGCLLPPTKPVVLTCAMRPATALVPDGPQNVLDALCTATDARATGVTVVAAGWVHSAKHISKVHTYRQDAFSSGDAGPVGCVEEGQVRWFGKIDSEAHSDHIYKGSIAIDFDYFSAHPWPRVELITSHAGATGDLVDAMLLQADGPRPVRGLVLACTGNGTLHVDMVAALQRAANAGVTVWRTSRCASGQVVGSVDVPELHQNAVPADISVTLGQFPASALSPVKARIALMLQLMAAHSTDQRTPSMKNAPSEALHK